MKKLKTIPKSKPAKFRELSEVEKDKLLEDGLAVAATHGLVLNPKTGRRYELRGQCKEAVECLKPQSILSGPRDTAKTFSQCIHAHALASKYPGCQGIIIRKAYVDMPGSVLQTFARVAGVVPYGKEKPQWYDYPNGSRIWVAGMDNATKALSSERDFAYVCQAEQLVLGDWEVLSGCVSGRAGNMPYPVLFGDCNPSGSKHWIKKSAEEGKLELFNAKHIDNPSLYDKNGKIVPGAEGRLLALENLTGIRRKRLFEGLWVSAEGAVYDNFDSLPGGPHVLERSGREMVRFYLAMDEGFSNPQVILLIGEDSDKRWHIFREWYVTKHLESQVVAQALAWWKDVRSAGVEQADDANHMCEKVACDDAAAGLIAAMRAAGMFVLGGKGRIIDGINKIQDRLEVRGDNKARLTVDPSCVNTINEFESYIWYVDKQGQQWDEPVDADNHSLSALRYMEDVLAEPTGAISSVKGISVGHTSLTLPRFMPRHYTPTRKL